MATLALLPRLLLSAAIFAIHGTLCAGQHYFSSSNATTGTTATTNRALLTTRVLAHTIRHEQKQIREKKRLATRPSAEIRGMILPGDDTTTATLDIYQTCFGGIGLVGCRCEDCNTDINTGLDLSQTDVTFDAGGGNFHWASEIPRTEPYCIECCDNLRDSYEEVEETWTLACPLTPEYTATSQLKTAAEVAVWGCTEPDSLGRIQHGIDFRFAKRAYLLDLNVTICKLERNCTRDNEVAAQTGQLFSGYHLNMVVTEMWEESVFFRGISECTVEPLYIAQTSPTFLFRERITMETAGSRLEVFRSLYAVVLAASLITATASTGGV